MDNPMLRAGGRAFYGPTILFLGSRGEQYRLNLDSPGIWIQEKWLVLWVIILLGFNVLHKQSASLK